MCFTEVEAREACRWLKAAGFPQYVQMYAGEYRVMCNCIVYLLCLREIGNLLVCAIGLNCHMFDRNVSNLIRTWSNGSNHCIASVHVCCGFFRYIHHIWHVISL